MRFGFKQPLVWEKRCVTTVITAAEETIGIITLNSVYLEETAQCSG